MKKSEELIYCTTKIVVETHKGELFTGTGFFMAFNINDETKIHQPVIITNKHVVENAKKISISICKGNGDNKPIDKEKIEISFDSFLIINHPEADVDLCAISISNIDSILHMKEINSFRSFFSTDLIITDEEIQNCSATEDIIMIGYPNGLEDIYNNKPIIRKGITSTHMKYDYNGKKEFLIDMACYPGSSGSPIFICNDSFYIENGNVCIGSKCRLLGILYAGPQYTSIGEIVFENISTNPKAIFSIPNNLGIVIKASRIKEIEEIMKTLN